jgi:Ca2+-binding RTX toxin-like protein
MAVVNGTAGNDDLLGTPQGDQISGLGGNDTLTGLGGPDTLAGGDGADVLVGDIGNDVLDGGAGDDRVLYYRENSGNGVLVDLQAGTARDTWGSFDTLISVEQVYGSVSGDTIRGRDGVGDLLFGREGPDLIEGRGGNDTLVGDQGGDTLNGGGGDDQVAYFLEQGPRGVVVDLRTGSATDTWGATDTLISIDWVFGSDRGDTITGTNGNDRLFGRAGDDVLNGLDGDNLIYTGAGNDRVIVGTTAPDARDTVVIDGAGNKVITGSGSAGTQYGHHLVFDLLTPVVVNMATGIATSANTRVDFTAAPHFLEVGGTGGDDLLIGGNPDHDTLEWFSGNQGNDTINGVRGSGDTVVYEDEVLFGAPNPLTGQREFGNRGVVVNLATGVATDTFGDRDTLLNIDDVRATRFADNITGSAGGNGFWGLAGADTLNGGEGSDSIFYGEDSLRGVGGTNGVTVDLTAGTAIDGFGDRDTLISIENVFTTRFADRVIGSAAANRIDGFEGNDTLLGLAGDDTILGEDGLDQISGGIGDDELWGGAGADTLDGGGGTDTARYGDAQAAVSVNLTANSAADGSGAIDTLISIENAWGSRFNDTLNGNADANRLTGDAGNDVINGLFGDDILLGGTGDDSLAGGAGDDELWGEAGRDTIDGGAGSDLVRYRTAPAGVFVNLTTGQAADGQGSVDTLISIEQVHGSDFADTLVGNGEDNRLFGFGGGDRMVGNAGADILLGGAGDDTILGGDGDDEIWGEAGRNDLDGGDGFDILRYRSATGGVLVDLGTGRGAHPDAAAADTLRGFEGAHGSDFADVLAGNAAANLLFGFDGADTLIGGTGDDTLSGGNGGDTYVFLPGDGGDIVNDLGQGTGGADRVVLLGYRPVHASVIRQNPNNESIVLDFGTSGDRIVLANTLGAGNPGKIEAVEFADGTVWSHAQLIAAIGQVGRDASTLPTGGDDILTGTPGNDTLDGEAGNDLLLARAGNNVLRGNEGDDTLRGGDGADTLDGGDGDDVITGGATAADLRDVIFAGAGNDRIDAGHGNDLVYGGDGDDTVEGGFGVDEIIGQGGNDVLTGSAFSDLIFGGDGNDFINGGFGSDRVNGGAGADRFYHLGIADHGSDWIQDYSAAEGDVLVWGGGAATRAQFQVNTTQTAGAGAAGVDEAFVIYRPTGQILWALVDGGAQGAINLQIGTQVFDLLS